MTQPCAPVHWAFGSPDGSLRPRLYHMRTQQGAEMDPKRTAVVLIEYQNDFTSEGGTLHDAVKPVMNSTNMLANTLEMVKKAPFPTPLIVPAPSTCADDHH